MIKSAPDNSRLDAFIRNTLKSSDENIPPFDWSELEVLLKHEQSSIPVQVDKKTILIGASAAGVLVLLFGLFKLIQHYSSLPPETQPGTDPSQNTFNTVDTGGMNAVAPSALKTDTVTIDSTVYFATEKRKLDSLAALAAADTAGKGKAEVPSVVKIPKEKKKKTDTTQKVAAPDTASVKTVSDTVSPPAPEEIKIAAPAVSDTSNKKVAPENAGSKKKKTKAKKVVPPPVEQTVDPPAAPSDSLK